MTGLQTKKSLAAVDLCFVLFYLVILRAPLAIHHGCWLICNVITAQSRTVGYLVHLLCCKASVQRNEFLSELVNPAVSLSFYTPRSRSPRTLSEHNIIKQVISSSDTCGGHYHCGRTSLTGDAGGSSVMQTNRNHLCTNDCLRVKKYCKKKNNKKTFFFSVFFSVSFYFLNVRNHWRNLLTNVCSHHLHTESVCCLDDSSVDTEDTFFQTKLRWLKVISGLSSSPASTTLSRTVPSTHNRAALRACVHMRVAWHKTVVISHLPGTEYTQSLGSLSTIKFFWSQESTSWSDAALKLRRIMLLVRFLCRWISSCKGNIP